jgi:hypothetical protein
MPPDIRQKYERAIRTLGNANDNHIPGAFEEMNIFAIPDFLENGTGGNSAVSSIQIIMDGKEFNGIENLPPEERARYEEAMGRLDANRNGVPDFVEGLLNTTNQTAKLSTSFRTETPRRSAPLPVSPTIAPDTSNGWMLVLTGLILLLLCAAGAAGIWYFFLR